MKEKLIKAVVGLLLLGAFLLGAFLLGAYLDSQTLQVVNNF